MTGPRWHAVLAAMHPGAFAAGYVLLSFASFPTPVSGLWRPLAMAVIAALAMAVAFSALVRNRSLGALLATAVVLTLSAVWLLAAVAGAALLWTGAVSLMRKTQKSAPLRWPGLPAANRMVGIFGAMFALVSMISAAPPLVRSVQFATSEPDSVEAAGSAPNIYMILLDGYPSADVLREYLSYDNSAFQRSLMDLEFAVSSDSRSNYTATWATLASMFHGEYLEKIPSIRPFPIDQGEQYLSLMEAINDATVLAELHARGYRIVTVPSPFEAAALVSADEMRVTGELTSFELSLLQHSRLLGPLLTIAPDYLLEQQKLRIDHAFESTAAVAAETSAGPTFMFTHVLNPHPPIVYESDGALADLPDCFPTTCSLWQMAEASQWAQLPAQIEHLNRLVIETVGRVISADPDAVIIVMSDHGSRPPGAPEEVLLQNVLAIRSPHQPNIVTRGMHLVDLLPTVFDAYFGTESPRHDYRGWLNVPEHPLEMAEVHPSP
jgi:hypothetical protein